MARVLKDKILENSRLAANYGGWMYCTNCDKNIGYLCYVTYDNLTLEYECNCGSHGSITLNFEDSKDGVKSGEDLIVLKNRLCCPSDHAPLITMLDKNVKHYTFEITCKECGKIYQKKQ